MRNEVRKISASSSNAGGARSSNSESDSVNVMASLAQSMQDLQQTMLALIGALTTISGANVDNRDTREDDRTAGTKAVADADADTDVNYPDDERSLSLSDSGEAMLLDRLPALSANRPESFDRVDSGQLAQLYHQLNAAANPTHGDESAGMSEGIFAAMPREGFGQTQEMDRLAEAVDRLADAILHGAGRSGSPMHPGEAAGGLNATLQTGTLTARVDRYN